MLSHKYQPTKRNHASLSTLLQSGFPPEVRKSGPLGLIVGSMLGVIIWLVFILFFALYWSSRFSLFQNIVVFIVTLCITGILIGLMWIIFGARKHRMWGWDW
jgi:amino acid transporter